jgi:hypothetical protein
MQRMTEGDLAEIPGTLVSDRKLSILISKAERGEADVKLARDEARELYDLMVQTYEMRLENQSKFHKLENDLMMKALKKLERDSGPSWYEHPVFVATISVVSTVAVFYGATEAVKAAQ